MSRPLPEITGGRGGSDDRGAADPQVAAAIEAFEDGTASERDALNALGQSRLLVPVVATLGEEHQQGPAIGGDKSSDMALPTLIGRDGRAAVPAFTSLDALNRWRPDARPVPTEAAAVWQAAVQQGWAVVIDVAGPVPLAIEGARLAALAAGEPVPPPNEDADVRVAIDAIMTRLAPGTPFELHPGGTDTDLVIEVAVSGAEPGDEPAFRAGPDGGPAAAKRRASRRHTLAGRIRRARAGEDSPLAPEPDLTGQATPGQLPADAAGETEANLAGELASELGAALVAQLGNRLRRGVSVLVSRRQGGRGGPSASQE